MLALASVACAHAKPRLETVLPPVAVDSNASVFATPMAVGDDGAVYTANVEPSNDMTGLKTVIRRGQRDRYGHWGWQYKTVEYNTVRDPYHTEASIALDRLGYVHVVYDMHNIPWQYSVSAQPNSIDHFIFRGQRASLRQRQTAKTNKIDFPSPGKAAIPGNQITYPAFFNDRRGNLYVTYRYAVRPKKPYFERTFAGAIARYNTDNGSWKQIGGPVRLNRRDADLPNHTKHAYTHPFAMEPGWWVYEIRLAFDRNNGMHASWLWRKGNAGGNVTRPSYAYSPPGSNSFYRSNGDAYHMPIRLNQAEPIISAAKRRQIAPDDYYAPANIQVTPSSNPLVTVQVIGGHRYSLRRSDSHRWQTPQKLPYNAWQIRYDDNGHELAFATGLTVLQRQVDGDGTPRSNWRVVFRGGDLCHGRVVQARNEKAYYIHANVQRNGKCRQDLVTIKRLSGL